MTDTIADCSARIQAAIRAFAEGSGDVVAEMKALRDAVLPKKGKQTPFTAILMAVRNVSAKTQAAYQRAEEETSICLTKLVEALKGRGVSADYIKAHLKLQNDCSKSALMLAAIFDHGKAVKLLLDHGADMFDVESGGSMSALHFAALNGSSDALQVMLSFGDTATVAVPLEILVKMYRLAGNLKADETIEAVTGLISDYTAAKHDGVDIVDLVMEEEDA